MVNTRNIFEKIATNRRGVIVATVVVCLVFLFAWWEVVTAPSNLEVFNEQEQVLTVSGEVLSESEPIHIRIPNMSIDAGFETPLGLEPSGEIEVPVSYDKVAYYGHGPTPGELGPAVILGHVDSFEGPAVFYGLGQLEEGDEIEIDREDGTTAVFAVTRLERHLQSGFPTQEVYQDIDHAGLRLITCSGNYDHGTLRYSHNLIVFAKLVDVR